MHCQERGCGQHQVWQRCHSLVLKQPIEASPVVLSVLQEDDRLPHCIEQNCDTAGRGPEEITRSSFQTHRQLRAFPRRRFTGEATFVSHYQKKKKKKHQKVTSVAEIKPGDWGEGNEIFTDSHFTSDSSVCLSAHQHHQIPLVRRHFQKITFTFHKS